MDTANAVKVAALVYRIKKGGKWSPVRVYLHETEAGRDKFLSELKYVYKDGVQVIHSEESLTVQG